MPTSVYAMPTRRAGGRLPPSPWTRWRNRVRGFLRRLGAVGLSLIVGPIVVTIIWLRFFGLPDGAKEYLLRELESRGLAVEFDRLLLDPTGGLLMDDLRVYRSPARKNILVQVDRARIGMAWFSWWQGHPFIESASVRNADIRLPIGRQEILDLEDVSATVDWDAAGLDVVRAEAKLDQIRFLFSGRIRLDAKVAVPEIRRTEEEMARRDALVRAFKESMAEITGPYPIQVQARFDVGLRDPGAGRVTASAVGKELRWRGVRIEELLLNARLAEGVAYLDDLIVRPTRGEWRAHGEWLLADKAATLEFVSNVDFTPFGSAIGGKTGEALNRLSFLTLPEVAGRLKMHWAHGFAFDLSADADWRDFSYARTKISQLQVALAYDGTRLLIADGQLVLPRGRADFEAFWNKAVPEVKGRLVSTLDFTQFEGALGDAADRFLQSVHHPGAAARIEAKLAGTGWKPDEMRWEGAISAAEPFFYKGVEFRSAAANFAFADSVLDLRDLKVTRSEGEASGNIVYDFANRIVHIANLRTSVDVQQVAPVLGGRFPDYVAPYRFSKPPQLKVDGTVDLRDQNERLATDLTVDIDADGVMRWKLFGVDFAFGEPRGLLKFEDRNLAIHMRKSRFFEGLLAGSLEMKLQGQNPPYETDLKLTALDFRKFMTHVFKHEESSGLMNGEASFSGRIGLLETINGKGHVDISDGYLTSIPFLGGLSALLSAVIPDFGYAKASDATCDFTLAKGYVATENLDIHSSNFTLIGEGRYHFVKDDLDLRIRANARGLMGAIFFPVSKLFEYIGTGPMKNVKWEPVNF